MAGEGNQYFATTAHASRSGKLPRDGVVNLRSAIPNASFCRDCDSPAPASISLAFLVLAAKRQHPQTAPQLVLRTRLRSNLSMALVRCSWKRWPIATPLLIRQPPLAPQI